MKIKIKKKRTVKIGNVSVGGGSPVKIQSMTSTQTADVVATKKQIKDLDNAGCEIIRVAIPDRKSLEVFPKLIAATKLPIIADIHFNSKLAMDVIKLGAQGIRINPGNIGSPKGVKDILKIAADKNCCIRIGVNSGSLAKKHITRKGKVTSRGLVNSALEFIEFFESQDFFNTKVSIKSSNVSETIEANRLFHESSDYPIHLGVTEAGTLLSGSIRSSVALGILLSEGIGDTIRVSLSSDPVKEIYVAYEILKSLGLRDFGVTVIACPTCSRKSFDVSKVAQKIENDLAKTKKPFTVAVMGCIVNGPGEASQADIGIAGGKGFSVLFEKGKVVKKIKSSEIQKELLKRAKNHSKTKV